MTIKIQNKTGEKTVQAEKGDTILKLLERNGLRIRKPCGGKGKCGKCLVRVSDTEGMPGKLEASLLGEKKRVQGLRVACLAKVDRPMTIVLGKYGASKESPVSVKDARDTRIAVVCASDMLQASVVSDEKTETPNRVVMPIGGRAVAEVLADALEHLLMQENAKPDSVREILLALEPVHAGHLRPNQPDGALHRSREDSRGPALPASVLGLKGLDRAKVRLLSPAESGDLSAMPLHVMLSLAATGIHRRSNAQLLEWPEWFHVLAEDGHVHVAAETVPLQQLLRRSGVGMKALRKIHTISDGNATLLKGCERLVGHPKRLEHLFEVMRKIRWIS